MPKETHRLTALEVKALSTPGRHADGGNLFLAISKSGSKSWSFLYRHHKRVREAGLGSLDKVSLKDAREKAAEGRQLLGRGLDPLAVWQAAKRASEKPTFAEAAAEYFETHREEWRSERHAAEWKRSLAAYTKAIAKLKVDEIEADDVLACLKPLWKRAPETASRVRGRIERVLSAAKAAGHVDKDKLNVARWRDGLEHRLSKKPKVKHFRALDYQDAPAFVAELRERRFTPSGAHIVSAFALEYLLLTATRSNETLGAQWSEINWEERTWTVPAWRTKREIEHVVPLGDGALSVLREMKAIECGLFVFPGKYDNAPLGPLTFVNLLRRMKIGTTAHGLRSTFRDWAGNETPTPREVCEHALAHYVGDQKERSYRRMDALAKRRELMRLWDEYLNAPPAGNVIAFKRA